MTAPQPTTPTTLRFWRLFGLALGVRLLVVALGILMIPVQPAKPIRVFGVGIAGFPADLRPNEPGPEELRYQILSGSGRVVEPWYRYDATWFCYIARDGYAHETRGPDGSTGPYGAAFPPVMPAILAGSDALGLNPFLMGLLLANLAGAAGTALIAQVAERLTSDREVGIRTFALLLSFPSAFFFSAPYHEPFGLLFTGLALTAWQEVRPLRASIFAALGSFARIAGVAVGVAAFGSWLLNDRTRRGFWIAFIVALGSGLGVVAYWGYVGWVVGSPFAALNAHAAWGRRSLSPVNPWYALQSVSDSRVLVIDLLSILLVSILGVRAWLRRGAFWGLLALVPIGLMLLSGTFLSGQRVILACVPAFIELADLLRNRTHFRLTVAFFALLQIIQVNRFVHWQWAG